MVRRTPTPSRPQCSAVMRRFVRSPATLLWDTIGCWRERVYQGRAAVVRRNARVDRSAASASARRRWCRAGRRGQFIEPALPFLHERDAKDVPSGLGRAPRHAYRRIPRLQPARPCEAGCVCCHSAASNCAEPYWFSTGRPAGVETVARLQAEGPSDSGSSSLDKGDSPGRHRLAATLDLDVDSGTSSSEERGHASRRPAGATSCSSRPIRRRSAPASGTDCRGLRRAIA
jgi:hypothetical protein